jgi:hypothetical protein
LPPTRLSPTRQRWRSDTALNPARASRAREHAYSATPRGIPRRRASSPAKYREKSHEAWPHRAGGCDWLSRPLPGSTKIACCRERLGCMTRERPEHAPVSLRTALTGIHPASGAQPIRRSNSTSGRTRCQGSVGKPESRLIVGIPLSLCPPKSAVLVELCVDAGYFMTGRFQSVDQHATDIAPIPRY